MATSTFTLRHGRLYDLLLADEINRTPQDPAALLEAMEERQVTIDGEGHSSRRYSQSRDTNPIEYEGTYPCRARWTFHVDDHSQLPKRG